MTAKEIIDCGCGTGRYFNRYFSQGARNVTGVDLSASMLQRARTKADGMNVFLLNASLHSLPVRDSAFDVGISTLALGYVRDLKKAISEMARVLRPGGTMLIADFHPVHKSVGWKRNFTVGGTGKSPTIYEIDHAEHSMNDYVHAFGENQLTIDVTAEPCVGPLILDVFEQFGMTRAYHRFIGTPILLIFKLRKH